MFGMDSFTQMPDPRDLAKIFDKSNPENTKWISFRDSEDSRFCSLVLPHVLRRLPYGPDANPVEDFHYEEDVSNEHEDYLWGNAAYDFAARLTAAFAKHHWCVAIRGPEGGGLVEGLPIHVFKSREGDVGAKCPTEVLIPDTREKELSDLGFIGLLHCKNTDYAAFFGGNSVQRPKKYDTKEATANAKLSSQIPYLMATSRIAHYLKSICRDKIGSFMSRTDVRDVPEPLDRAVRAAAGRRQPEPEGAAAAARSADRRDRRQGAARLLQGDRLPAARTSSSTSSASACGSSRICRRRRSKTRHAVGLAGSSSPRKRLHETRETAHGCRPVPQDRRHRGDQPGLRSRQGDRDDSRSRPGSR